MSIHTAYVKAIRAAQHYIYIENQYFIGSSYNWSQHKDLGANNLIPMEIALKIAAKIRANERLAVYIVIPMWRQRVFQLVLPLKEFYFGSLPVDLSTHQNIRNYLNLCEAGTTYEWVLVI
ncbi:hypothetical protein GLYMA_20G049901v4 [Glycine max]|nr:hypothetical protein GLYMA_20G049901v4 [Glycine max]KAH1034589.1 hypothetical protein GYH30_054832 [Glycine max]